AGLIKGKTKRDLFSKTQKCRGRSHGGEYSLSFNETYTAELPLVPEKNSFKEIDDAILAPTERMPGKAWYVTFGVSLVALLIGAVSLWLTVYEGIGMWGNNSTIGWGFGIINFVFWIGIGHAGTLISAILYLFR